MCGLYNIVIFFHMFSLQNIFEVYWNRILREYFNRKSLEEFKDFVSLFIKVFPQSEFVSMDIKDL